jgi:hypothetical protein
MASDAKMAKVSVGFQGGQVLALRIPEDELGSLRKALLGGSGGWHELASDDGAVQLDLAEVVYLRTDSGEPHVGFGS